MLQYYQQKRFWVKHFKKYFSQALILANLVPKYLFSFSKRKNHLQVPFVTIFGPSYDF